MAGGPTTAFCPKCEGKFSPEREECPEDGAKLLTYEIVEEQRSDPLVGSVFEDRFRVEEPLSKGGMGTVYRGSQVGVDREVAIKVLEGEAAAEEHQVRRFLREARTISKLSHPNIVNFIDFGQDPEYQVLYLVMGLIEGVELSTLLDDARLAPNLAVGIVAQMCSALAEPHHQGVIHRDLKPANVMLQSRLDGSMQVKLVDFGIANAVHRKTRLTQTGVACGTPHYMAPEQVDSKEESPAIDVYGLGAILFRMLSGRVVFDAESDVQILFKHVKQAPPNLGDAPYADEIPNALIDLVHSMLRKPVDERPESVLEVRERLRAIRKKQPNLDELQLDPELPPERALQQWVIPRSRRSPIQKTPDTGGQNERPDTSQTESPPEPTEGAERKTLKETAPVESVETTGDDTEATELRTAVTGSASVDEHGIRDTIQDSSRGPVSADDLDAVSEVGEPTSSESVGTDERESNQERTTQTTAEDARTAEGRFLSRWGIVIAGVAGIGILVGAAMFALLRNTGTPSKAVGAAERPDGSDREETPTSAGDQPSEEGDRRPGAAGAPDTGAASHDAGSDREEDTSSGAPTERRVGESSPSAPDEEPARETAPSRAPSSERGATGSAGTRREGRRERRTAGRGTSAGQTENEGVTDDSAGGERADETDSAGTGSSASESSSGSDDESVDFEPVPHGDEESSDSAEESDSMGFEPVPSE